jgi:hypothetical protein
VSTVLEFTVFGELASKANSRELVTRRMKDEQGNVHNRVMFIKSKKARSYEADALKQIPPKCRVRLQGPVCVTLDIFYASERPDLDESVLLDVMQDRYQRIVLPNGEVKRELIQNGCYRNDRQVRKKIVTHYIDRANPRAIVRIEPMQMQQDQFDFNEEDDENRNDEECAF